MVLAKVKIGLISRSLMQNSVSAPQIGGIVKMTRFILRGTFSIELFGAILLAIYFCPKYGLGKGIWFSIFHSISAFCNAGFDLMGTAEPFSSLTAQVGNWYVNLIIMSLIVVGGLGFFVWRDILNTRLHFTKMQLHTKLVLTARPCVDWAIHPRRWSRYTAATHECSWAVRDQMCIRDRF